MTPDIVLPDLPEGYTWNTEDGDYNIIKGKNLHAPGCLICYVRLLSRKTTAERNVVHSYLTRHKEENFNKLQDAINVMATRFTLGIYFQDETT